MSYGKPYIQQLNAVNVWWMRIIFEQPTEVPLLDSEPLNLGAFADGRQHGGQLARETSTALIRKGRAGTDVQLHGEQQISMSREP